MTRLPHAHPSGPILDRHGNPIPPYDPWPEFDMEDHWVSDALLFVLCAASIVFLFLVYPGVSS